MAKSSFNKNSSYNFSDYFYLSGTTAEIVAEFDYKFAVKKLELPRASLENVSLERLRSGFYNKVKFVPLNSETARREFFISPLFLELLDYVEANINIEYALEFDEKLKGSIDYFLRSQQSFVVVKAKFADMEHGFTQLAIEMIAIDKFYKDEQNEIIFGAVTVGDFWRFGILDRRNKIVYKDIDAYGLPTHLEDLFSILLGVLRNNG